jgi:branched-chain amino acid transport system permease protein
MVGALINQLLQGVLLGGLYTLFATGLSFSAGVMRFVNIAHGDFIVLACFALLTMTTTLGLHPVVALVLLLVILVTFGLSIIIQNGLLEVYGADTHKVAGGWIETSTIALGPSVNVGLFSVLTFIAAVIVVASLDLLLYRSGIGVKIRAVSDDVATADLIGLSSARIYGVAMGISFVTIGIAAGFMSIWSNFDPSAGPTHLLIAFEVIVLGGLGSMWGSLAGGVVLGVAQTIGAQFDAAWQIMAGHIVFLAVLVVRPHGLFPRH